MARKLKIMEKEKHPLDDLKNDDNNKPFSNEENKIKKQGKQTCSYTTVILVTFNE